MKKGIILESAVPMRLDPSDKSEMVNQLLFGEQYDVLQEAEKWIRIKSFHDSYEGWIDLKQHSENVFDSVVGEYCKADAVIRHKERGNLKITPGSFLPAEDLLSKLDFKIEEYKNEPKNLRSAVQLFENSPYLWGGRTPLGIDCSGFTQLVYRLLGVNLPRDAAQQVEVGELVSFVEESKEGDLAFFDNADGKITHVGIILEENGAKMIIHASGRVRTDNLDHNGIYNEQTQSYSHKLRTIKKINNGK